MKRFLFLFLFAASVLHAQAIVAPLELVRQQFFSATGVPLAYGCLVFNATGTSTPQAIYGDSTGLYQALNPYQLDAAGMSNIWMTNTGYDITAYTGVTNLPCSSSLGSQLWQQTNVNPFSILNVGSNYIIASGTSDPVGTPGELSFRSDLPCLRFFISIWDCLVETTLVQTVTNKSIRVDQNTISNVTNTAGHYLRNNGTQYVDSALQTSDLPGISITIPNSATGTIQNALPIIAGTAPSQAFRSATSTTGGVVGITIAGAGVSGSATIQQNGLVNCIFDGATTAGDYVQISSTVAGDCHDPLSSARPTSGQIIGFVLSTNGGGGTYAIDLFPNEIVASSPAVVFNSPSNAVTIAIGSTGLVTPVITSVYRFSAYVTQSVLGTSCSSNPTVTLSITWQDQNAAAPQSEVVGVYTISGNGTLGVVPLTTASSPGTLTFRAKAAVTINYSTTYTGLTGCSPNPTYQVFPILEQLTTG
jgi:hypothetical protein